MFQGGVNTIRLTFREMKKARICFLESKQENLKNVAQNHLTIFRFYNFGTFARCFCYNFQGKFFDWL